MLRLDIDISGLEPLIMRLDAAPSVVDLEMQSALISSALAVAGQVRSRTPIVTGRLFSSIDYARISPTEVKVRTDVSYAPYVEGGRGPIRARRTRALGPMRGIGFRRSVGRAEGRFMFREGLRASLPQIRDAFRDAARRVTGFIAGK